MPIAAPTNLQKLTRQVLSEQICCSPLGSKSSLQTDRPLNRVHAAEAKHTHKTDRKATQQGIVSRKRHPLLRRRINRTITNCLYSHHIMGLGQTVCYTNGKSVIHMICQASARGLLQLHAQPTKGVDSFPSVSRTCQKLKTRKTRESQGSIQRLDVLCPMGLSSQNGSTSPGNTSKVGETAELWQSEVSGLNPVVPLWSRSHCHHKICQRSWHAPSGLPPVSPSSCGLGNSQENIEILAFARQDGMAVTLLERCKDKCNDNGFCVSQSPNAGYCKW